MGEAALALESRGVTVLFAEGLLDRALEKRIDVFVDDLLGAWHWDDQGDFSRVGNLSLGRLVDYFLLAELQPGILVRTGEIFHALFRKFSDANKVITDIRDGACPLVELGGNFLPRRKLLGDVAGACGIAVHDRTGQRIPPLIPPNKARPGFGEVVRAYLGGLRPTYLTARIRILISQKSTARVYFFLSHIKTTATVLAERPGIDVFSDQSGLMGVVPVRHDHLLPTPSLKSFLAVRRLRRRAVDRLDRGGVARFHGFDYGPYLAPGVHEFCRERVMIAAIKASQTLRLWRRLKPDVVVIGSDAPIPALTTILSKPFFPNRIVNLEHGLNSTPYGTWVIGCNHSNLTVVVPGEGQMGLFGSRLPEAEKPRRVILPLPITSQVESIRGHRRPASAENGARVLMLNYSPQWTFAPHRAKKMDRYTLDIFRASRILSSEGVRVSFRPAPILNLDYFNYLGRLAGAEDIVEFDREKDFAVSLARHHVVVTNLTTCYYQALYAGWPTIFYEPDYDRGDFLGLIADETINPPRAETPEQLVELIRQAISEEGRVAAFPAEFRDKHLERFLGPNPDKTDAQLASFLNAEAQAAFTESTMPRDIKQSFAA